MTDSDDTVRRHLVWFDVAPTVSNDRLAESFRTFVEGQPFHRGPKHDWVRFLPPVNERLDFVMNLGVDGFGLAYVLFVVSRNCRVDASTAVRASIGSSLGLLRYGMSAVLQRQIISSGAVRSTSSVIPVKRNRPEVASTVGPSNRADTPLSPRRAEVRELRLASSKAKARASTAVARPSKGLPQIMRHVRLVVVSDSDLGDVEVVNLDSDEERDDDGDEVERGKGKSKGRSVVKGLTPLEAVRRSKRRKTTGPAPDPLPTCKIYPPNKEFGCLYWYWAREKDEYEFMNLLHEFHDIHSMVSYTMVPPEAY